MSWGVQIQQCTYFIVHSRTRRAMYEISSRQKLDRATTTRLELCSTKTAFSRISTTIEAQLCARLFHSSKQLLIASLHIHLLWSSKPFIEGVEKSLYSARSHRDVVGWQISPSIPRQTRRERVFDSTSPVVSECAEWKIRLLQRDFADVGVWKGFATLTVLWSIWWESLGNVRDTSTEHSIGAGKQTRIQSLLKDVFGPGVDRVCAFCLAEWEWLFLCRVCPVSAC